MTYVCLYSSTWTADSITGLLPRLLKIVPRLSIEVERQLIWADARSLMAKDVIIDLIAASIQQDNSIPQVGVSLVPITAEVAARFSREIALSPAAATTHPTTTVLPGREREFLAPQPIFMLEPSPHLASLFDGVGIEKCGDLARLEGESVEVRFGAEGMQLWRLARADDRRMIFKSAPRSLPEATLDWVDYTLTDPERLVFVINALVDNVCTSLGERGQCAREMTLVFSLANRTSYEHLVRPARSTASRKAWMRLIRTHLDTIVLADGVTGITLRVEAITGEVERQGDIFDRGFATARATEETVAQLLDDQGAVIVVPSNTRHPLLERRTNWLAQEPAHAARTHTVRESPPVAEPSFTLQLLQTPRAISVRTARRRDHDLPIEYRDNEGWVMIESAAGPDRVSGGRWEEGGAYAREYFRCVTEEGMLVWIFRDVGEAADGNWQSSGQSDSAPEGGADAHWYMHGWWD